VTAGNAASRIWQPQHIFGRRGGIAMTKGKRPRTEWRRYWPRFLLLIPFGSIVWVPFYNRIEPELGGIPFFYWYQIAWILLGALVVFAIYLIETRITGVTKRTEPGFEITGSPGDVL
jgi:Protein of unknown function (DUF3311)